jgi:hypothetical protein
MPLLKSEFRTRRALSGRFKDDGKTLLQSGHDLGSFPRRDCTLWSRRRRNTDSAFQLFDPRLSAGLHTKLQISMRGVIPTYLRPQKQANWHYGGREHDIWQQESEVQPCGRRDLRRLAQQDEDLLGVPPEGRDGDAEKPQDNHASLQPGAL